MGIPSVSLSTPPRDFEDLVGRDIRIRRIEVDPGSREFELLVQMYLDLSGQSRSMGIPPVGDDAIKDWLVDLGDGIHLAAWFDDSIVGHATLLSDGRGSYELAIFVHQDYQQAGIGTELLRTLLGAGEEEGVELVWLTVSTGNAVAKRLFQSAGFSVTNRSRRQLEMELIL